MHTAWTQVLAEAENVANHHLLVSEKLNLELRKTVKYQAQENEKRFKEVTPLDFVIFRMEG
jgi:hypothetical protein